MPKLTRTVPPEEAAAALRPRHDVVVEAQQGPGCFTVGTGPFAHYQRRLRLQPDGSLVETVDYRLARAVWFPFPLLIRSCLRRTGRGVPWWAPPQVFDAAGASSLGLLVVVSIISAYLGTLLTQTITFAADDFGVGPGGQGVTLAAVRFGVLGALVITALADRRGRRGFLLGSLAAACAITFAGALSPNLAALGASQLASRGLVTASAVLVAVVAAEEMPAGSRAYGVSILVMAGALGVGLCLALLPLADVGDGGWRLLYLVPVLFLPALAWVGRHLPESRRFRAPHENVTMAGHGKRFWLLAVSALLVNLFASPVSQFMNEFLREERGFSAARITLFAISTNTPGAIGIIVGGRLADLRGRRGVGAVGVIGGTIATVAMFWAAGWSMWALSIVGAIVGAATIPALGVYGPELFPTSLRGRANGIITLLGVVGASVGLLTAGLLADAFSRFAPAFTLLALGPALMALLVIAWYPETAGRSLEALNPEDRDPDDRGPPAPPPPPVP